MLHEAEAETYEAEAEATKFFLPAINRPISLFLSATEV